MVQAHKQGDFQMKKLIVILAAGATLALPVATAVYSAAHSNPFSAHIAARQGQMNIQSFNIGVLGGMARGNTEYDADAAQTAADNLAALAMMDGRALWPEGSDNAALGDATRALPAIWEDMGAFGAEWQAYGEAVSGMQEAAGGGLEALQAAMGPLGSSCGSCHEDFRQSNN